MHSTRIVIAGTLALLFGSRQLLGAEKLEHLGAPPPGKAFVTLKTSVSLAPIQFMGTVEPPAALMSGKQLKTEKIEKPGSEFSAPGPAVWLNRVPVQTAGNVGRFFVQLPPSEAGAMHAELIMKTAQGEVHRAWVELNRIFLDAPIELRVLASAQAPEPDAKFEFVVTGSIPVGSRLDIEGAEIRELSRTDEISQPVEAELELPIGKQVILAKLENASGASRVINVPAEVTHAGYRQEEIALSIEIPDGQEAGRPWTIPANGFHLEGLTNPGAKLSIGGEPVSVARRGSFSHFFRPTTREQVVTIDVALPQGASKSFKKTIRCEECAIEPTWYAPRFRAGGEVYLTASAGGWLNYSAGGVNGASVFSKPVAAALSLGIGNWGRHNLAYEIEVQTVPAPLKRTLDGGELAARAAFSASAGFLFAPFPQFGLGAAVLYQRMHVSESGFPDPSISGIHQTAGLELRATGRFVISSAFEIVPRVRFAPSSLSLLLYESTKKWSQFAFEPLVVRFYP